MAVELCTASVYQCLGEKSKGGRELAKCWDCGKTVTVCGSFDADGWSQHYLYPHKAAKR